MKLNSCFTINTLTIWEFIFQFKYQTTMESIWSESNLNFLINKRVKQNIDLKVREKSSYYFLKQTTNNRKISIKQTLESHNLNLK